MAYNRRRTTKFNGKEHIASANKQLETCKYSASSLDKKRLIALRKFIDSRLKTLYGDDGFGYL